MPQTMASTQTLYDLMYGELLRTFPGLSSKKGVSQFQFPGTPNTKAAWYADPGAKWYSWLTAEQLPEDHADLFVPKNHLTTSYQQWVRSIKALEPTDIPAYQALETEKGNVLAQLRKANDMARSDYEIWKRSPDGQEYAATINTMELWLQSRFGRSDNGPIVDLDTRLADIARREKQYMSGADWLLQQVLASLDKPTERKDLVDASAQTHEGCLIQNVGGDLAYDWGRWTQGLDLKNLKFDFTNASEPYTQMITLTRRVYHEKSYFFGLYTSTSVSYETFTTELTSYDDFKFSVQLPGINYYDMSGRLDWFSSELLQTYKNRPCTSYTPATFFDPEQGTLTLVPDGVLVYWNPIIAVDMSADTYSRYQAAIDSTNGFKAGPFYVGVGYKPTVTKVGNNVTVRYIDPNPKAAAPQIGGYHFTVTIV